MATPTVDSPAKSLTVLKQVIRADGTRGPVEIAAYMDRDPDRMQRVIDGEILPDTVTTLDGITAPQKVAGACTSGKLVVDMLNSVPEEVADRIAAINAVQAESLQAARNDA